MPLELTDGPDGFEEGTAKSSGRNLWSQSAKDSDRTNFVPVQRKNMTFVHEKDDAFTSFLPSF
jgi:hypothetical protein